MATSPSMMWRIMMNENNNQKPQRLSFCPYIKFLLGQKTVVDEQELLLLIHISIYCPRVSG